ncbi:hypothetical protein FKM82_026532 [Ascaphus truei]
MGGGVAQLPIHCAVEMAVNGADAAGLRQTAAMYEQLKAEWIKKSPNLGKCGDVLGKLKLALLEQNFLPTTGVKLTKQQLILARKLSLDKTINAEHNMYQRRSEVPVT